MIYSVQKCVPWTTYWSTTTGSKPRISEYNKYARYGLQCVDISLIYIKMKKQRREKMEEQTVPLLWCCSCLATWGQSENGRQMVQHFMNEVGKKSVCVCVWGGGYMRAHRQTHVPNLTAVVASFLACWGGKQLSKWDVITKKQHMVRKTNFINPATLYKYGGGKYYITSTKKRVFSS